MKVVSPFLKHVMYPGLSKLGCLPRSECPAVLTYHGVVSAKYRSIDSQLDGNLIREDRFREQLDFLQREYSVIRPEQFYCWLQGQEQLPDRSVLLTCDDGLKVCLTEMVPILRSFNFSCLFFVTGISLEIEPRMLWHDELWLILLAAKGPLECKFISDKPLVLNQPDKRRLWWDLVKKMSMLNHESRATLISEIKDQIYVPKRNSAANLSELEHHRLALMNVDDLRALSNLGMSIGAHTLSHPVLSMCNDKLAWNEVAQCKQLLETSLGTEICAMSYPFGDPHSVGAREQQLAFSAEFACAFLNCEGNAAASDRFALPRVHVTHDMRLPEFAAHVSGIHHGLKKLLAYA